jgi:hypothetical protein
MRLLPLALDVESWAKFHAHGVDQYAGWRHQFYRRGDVAAFQELH